MSKRGRKKGSYDQTINFRGRLVVVCSRSDFVSGLLK